MPNDGNREQNRQPDYHDCQCPLCSSQSAASSEINQQWHSGASATPDEERLVSRLERVGRLRWRTCDDALAPAKFDASEAGENDRICSSAAELFARDAASVRGSCLLRSLDGDELCEADP